MSLPKKGARTIVVDGQRFRWTVRPKPTYAQGNAWSAMTFAAESVENPGRTLHVELVRPRPDNWMLEASAPITPTEVAGFIRKALDSGWKPSEPGSPFELAESSA